MAKALVCDDLSEFHYPEKEYLRRIAETESAHHYLDEEIRSQEGSSTHVKI